MRLRLAVALLLLASCADKAAPLDRLCCEDVRLG
jgi:hypothetical protein